MAYERSNARRDLWTGPILFGVIVAIGAAFIVMAKTSGFPPLAVTGLPILFMLAYAIILALPATRLRDDQSGDNLYYMGFLYTLTSLGVSLYQFSSGGTADQIIQSFGIAIGSTIAGVALRVIFSQMRRDPVEVEREARLELAEAARRMRRELDTTVIDMANFQRTMTQVITDGFRSLQEKVAEASNLMVNSIEQTVERTREPLVAASKSSSELIEAMGKATTTRIDEIAAGMAQRLDQSGTKLTAENDRMADAAAKVAASLQGLVEKLQGMQTPDKVIEMKLDPLMKPLIKASADVTKRSEAAVQAHGEQAEKTEKIVRDMSVLATQLKVMINLSERNQNDMQMAIAAFREAGDRIASEIQAVSRAGVEVGHRYAPPTSPQNSEAIISETPQPAPIATVAAS